MRPTSEAMLLQPTIVKEPIPEAKGIEPLPEIETESQRTSEAYSEAGLSGEAVVGMNDEDSEPFMLRQRSSDELADYDDGFKCGYNGGQNNGTKSKAWQRGWAKSQE